MDTDTHGFLEQARERLLPAFTASFGPHDAADALAHALEVAWRREGSVRTMSNPFGYLYRAGANHVARRRPPLPRDLLPATDPGMPWVEPRLLGALAALSTQQRTCVLLVHAFEWTYQEVADLLHIRRSSVQTHVDRAMRSLKAALEASDDSDRAAADR